MSERKNIDTFFKERLAHFEVSPPEMAWDNIEEKLKEKEEKRRIIPFWWKFSGVAAILFLGFMLLAPYFNGNGYFNNPKKQNNPVVNQQNKNTTDQETNNANPSTDEASKNQENGIANQENKSGNPSNGIKTPAWKVKETTSKNALRSNSNPLEKVAAISNTKTEKKKKSYLNKKGVSSDKMVSDDATASNANNKKSSRNQQNIINNNPNSSEQLKSNTSVTPDGVQTNLIDVNKNIAEINGATKDKNTITSIENTAQKIDEIKKIDSTKLADVEPNALEELLNEKEKKIAKGRKENRWQVTPNIAPIYFSSMSSGSPLDEKLATNEKVYGTNYSYGLGVNYAVNKKLKIRSGIHTFSADYDTKGIVFYQNTNASKMQNVTPTLQGSLIQIDPLSNVNASFGRLIEEKFEGTLNQRMAYIEMPVEVSYRLLSKKFGVDLIGGVSTLFLSQNDVYLKSDGFTMKIGEANNLNNIHFSTNIGLGFKYSFLKRFDARVEPLFKYQLNTYSSGAGNFKPYVFGVYSGISYHF